MIAFGRHAAEQRSARGLGKPETFDFLGFTHICGKAKEGGWFTLVRHTIAKRMRAKLVEIKEALNRMRHVPVPEQGRWLGQVVRGYLAYHLPQFAEDHVLPPLRRLALAARAFAPKPEGQRVVGADGEDRRALVATRQDQSSLAGASFSRQTPEVGAERVSSARSDLSGDAG